jgi:RND family efflux transporter MFP subunit
MSRLSLRILRFLLPVVLLGGASLAAYLMYLNRPAVETQAPPFEPPSVRVQRVEFQSVGLIVTSQGTVQPRTSSQLVPEISGPITEVAQSFAVGGFFEAGDVLLKIDPYDYQQAVITARSQLAQAELRLAQEEAEAAVARREWEELGRGDPSALTLRQPQVQEARAAVAAAEAALDRGARDLERAEIKAPYAGRVQSKEVDIGQFVSKGDRLAGIYAVDSAEIRLPLPDEELAYVDVPLSYRGGGRQTGPPVTLSADFAGRRHTWQGRVVRTESEIDPVSRMVHVVAEVRDPYVPGSNPSRPPLAAGMFVEAEIEGRTVTDVVVLPWAALRGRDQVLVVDDSSRLRYRQVEVLRSTREEVLIRSGLAEGERVSVSALDAVTEGMVVSVLDDGLRMARATAMTSDAQAPPPPAPSAPEPDPVPDTEQQRATSERAAPEFDIDPTLSREEQIAALRRQIESLNPVTSASPPAPPPRPAASNSSLAPPRAVEAVEAVEDASRARRADAGAAGASAGGGRAARRERGARGGRGRAGRGAAPAAAPRTAPDAAPAADRPTDTAATTGGIAVLPFSNVSRNAADDWIGGDMTSALRTALADTDAGRVVTLTTDDEALALETAEARNAQWLVGGGYQRSGDRLRVTARVLEVAGGTLVRSFKMDGAVGELETLTSNVVAAVRAELGDASAAPRTVAERDPVPRTDLERRRSVMVVPFANITRNPADDRLGGDMASAMADGLRQLDGVSVVRLDEPDEGVALESAAGQSAAWLISGGYQHVGGRLRITARLLDVATGELVQTVKVDGTLDELPDLLTEALSTLRAALEARSARVIPYRQDRALMTVASKVRA